MAKKELYMQKLNKQIDKFLDIIVESILGGISKEEATALTLWPLPTPQGVLYWGNEWVKKLNRVFHLINKQKVSNKEIIKAIKFPSRIVQLLWRVDAIKDSGLSKKELENHKKDLYFFSGKSKKLNRLISEFEAILWSYTEILYWAQHPLGHSFHGPYLDKEGDLLVKEYFDLKPEIWSFSQNLNFSEVEIFKLYKKETGPKIKLEFFERNIRTIQSLKEDLEKFALRIDGNIIKKPEEISQFSENLMRVIKKGSKVIQSLNEQQLIEKHADYYFYVIKPFCDLVKEDWHPSQQVRDNIYKRYKRIDAFWQNVVKKNFEKTATLPYKQQAKILKEIFDPRIG